MIITAAENTHLAGVTAEQPSVKPNDALMYCVLFYLVSLLNEFFCFV